MPHHLGMGAYGDVKASYETVGQNVEKYYNLSMCMNTECISRECYTKGQLSHLFGISGDGLSMEGTI